MKFILAFLSCGLFCMLSQIILDSFKITPGHVTSLFTFLGSVLAFFGIYDYLIFKCGAGVTILISYFGYALYDGAITSYINEGFLGLFTGLLVNCSAALSSAIIFAFIFTILFKAKN